MFLKSQMIGNEILAEKALFQNNIGKRHAVPELDLNIKFKSIPYDIKFKIIRYGRLKPGRGV